MYVAYGRSDGDHDALSAADLPSVSLPRAVRPGGYRPASAHPPATGATKALQAARARMSTPAFQAEYASRAGVEGLLSQGVRAFGLRRARYPGLAKTQLQQWLTVTAINLVRLDAWLSERPRAVTRPSRLAAVLSQPWQAPQGWLIVAASPGATVGGPA